MKPGTDPRSVGNLKFMHHQHLALHSTQKSIANVIARGIIKRQRHIEKFGNKKFKGKPIGSNSSTTSNSTTSSTTKP